MHDLPDGLSPQPSVIHRNDDGTVLGILDDVLYDGEVVAVAYDQIETTVVDEGDRTRVFYHVDGWIQGAADLAGSPADNAGPEAGVPVGTSIQPGPAVYIDEDGHAVTVERRKQIVRWTERP